MTKQERLMRLNGVRSIKKPASVEEVNAKMDALIEYMCVQGHWNGKLFEIIKAVPETGDYTNPIKWRPGDPVAVGMWYYANDKGLPHEAIAAGVPLNFNDAKFFDFVE